MRFRLFFVRVLSLVAMAVSAAQFADYLTGAGAICKVGDTCEQVTESIYGKPFGVPLSAIGFASFALLFTTTLIPTRWAVRLVRLMSTVAGLAGIGLLAIQIAVLHKICPLCLIVDTTSIVLALLVAVGPIEAPVFSKFRVLGWSVAGAGAMLIPVFLTAALLPTPTPQQVQKHWEIGRVTVVEVADFECQHCQQLDPILRKVLKHHDVNFVRLVAPMPVHENGKPAARAYFAAKKLGKGEEMAEELFAADTRTAVRCRELARKIGLDLTEYDRFMQDPDRDDEYRDTLAWVLKDRIGVPSVYVQDQVFQGVPSPEALENAISNAKPPITLK